MTFTDTLPDLAQQFAPLVHFHHHEQNMPCSTDWYLSQVGYVHTVGGAPTVTYQPGEWEPLNQFPYPSADAGDYLFIPGDEVASWNPPEPAASIRAGDPASATAYVHAVPVTKDADGNPVEWLDLQYWFFYAFNGAESIVAQEGRVHESSLTNMSFHEADWEHVVVRIDSSSNIVGVYFAQHDRGEWVPPATQDPKHGYSLTNGSQLVVYAGLGSHASYPRPGGPFWIARVSAIGISFGMADWTEDSGQKVDYGEAGRTVVVRNDATQWFDYTPPSLPWMSFAGHWGVPATIPLTPVDITADIVGITGNWKWVNAFEDLISPLADDIYMTLKYWDANGPASLPFQSGWNPQYSITAAVYGNGAWASFRAPHVGTMSALACATEEAGGSTLIHAAYVGTDGYVYYIQYNGNDWVYADTQIPGQQATNSPAITVLDGTVYVVFQNDAKLYYATATSPDYDFGPAVPVNNPGICDVTSPALFVQYGIVYCLYQDYGSPGVGNGTLHCLAYIADQQQWIDQSPNTANYPGMSNSPAAAMTNPANVYVVYQGYKENQQLWGTCRNGGSWLHLTQDNLPPHMSASPGAAALGSLLYVAIFGPDNYSMLSLVQYDGSTWTVDSTYTTTAVAGCSPTLIACDGQLVAFYQTMS